MLSLIKSDEVRLSGCVRDRLFIYVHNSIFITSVARIISARFVVEYKNTTKMKFILIVMYEVIHENN